jgi:hypothetical protein
MLCQHACTAYRCTDIHESQAVATWPKGKDIAVTHYHSSRPGRSRPSAFFSIVHAFLHGFCQLLLVLGQQRFNLVVRFVADRVDLRAEVLA